MKEFKGDKRSKAYKEWKKNFDKENNKGVGDVIEKITEKTGIKKAVKFIAGEDCGCDKRKEKLNTIKIKFTLVRCFTEDLYKKWSDFKERNPSNLNINDQMLIIDCFNHLFARSLKKQSCCYEKWINEIDAIYDKY